MAKAATISVPLTSQARRSLTSISLLRCSSPTPQLNFLRVRTATSRSPNLHVSATSSMKLEAAEKVSPAVSFLDRRESGFLHFVKYHGLGNDFILVKRSVCLLRASFFTVTFNTLNELNTNFKKQIVRFLNKEKSCAL